MSPRPLKPWCYTLNPGRDTISLSVPAAVVPSMQFKNVVIQALAATGMQPGQLIAQAFSGLAEKAEKIGQLNVSPELLNSLMQKPAEAARVRP